MQEIFEKIKERLKELGWVFAEYYPDGTAVNKRTRKSVAYDDVVEIVNQIAEEYKHGHYGCNFNGQHEKCKDCGLRGECSHYNTEWFGSNSEIPNMSDVPDKNVGENDRWIPCSSGKMPENGRRCWVTYEWANGSLHVDKDYLVNGKWFETEDEAVKAWMYNDEETPAPYKPKGEK